MAVKPKAHVPLLKIRAGWQQRPEKPLSTATADLLAKDGLDIYKMHKYRIAENIPSTRQRRSFAK